MSDDTRPETDERHDDADQESEQEAGDEQAGDEADADTGEQEIRQEDVEGALERGRERRERDADEVLDGHAVEAELLEDWRIMFDVLHARFETDDFATGLQLVDRIGKEAERRDHHPDLDLRYGFVDVRLSSHDVGGVTQRDIDFAREITDLAGRSGASPAPHRISVLELALDTHDAEEIKPFWAALLGYDEPDDDDRALMDPQGRGPTLWFQETERHDPPRQRFHLDLRVPPEVATGRVKAALEAGGTLVSDERQPSFTVLADAQGNQACVTTWLGRSS